MRLATAGAIFATVNLMNDIYKLTTVFLTKLAATQPTSEILKIFCFCAAPAIEQNHGVVSIATTGKVNGSHRFVRNAIGEVRPTIITLL